MPQVMLPVPAKLASSVRPRAMRPTNAKSVPKAKATPSKEKMKKYMTTARYKK